MHIAFYKGGKGVFSKMITIKQSLNRHIPKKYTKYTHTEVLFSDGISFSSSERDGGTRFKKIDYKKASWDYIEIPVSKAKEKKVRDFCKSIEGLKYDWIGVIFAQGLNIFLDKPNCWFCSEAETRALQEIHILCTISACMVSPAKLYTLLKQHYEQNEINKK